LRIERAFPLEQTADTQKISAEGRVTGKLIISIG
jgi:hypothetical protein